MEYLLVISPPIRLPDGRTSKPFINLLVASAVLAPGSAIANLYHISNE